jgi:hypothetical protein
MDMSRFYVYQPPYHSVSFSPGRLYEQLQEVRRSADGYGKHLLVLLGPEHITEIGRDMIANNHPVQIEDVRFQEWILKADHVWLLVKTQILVLKSKNQDFNLSVM